MVTRSEDVLPRPADADEVHVGLRRWLQAAEEREVELHALRILPGGFRVPGFRGSEVRFRVRFRVQESRFIHSLRIAISGSTAIARRAGM